jgi:WD repeat-containing protein 49
LTNANTAWKGGQCHQEDILAIDFCPPNILATASFDGEIAIWSLETETLFKKLKRIRQEGR